MAMMKKFHFVRDIQECVWQELIGGARVALRFVRVHHPHIDMEVIGSGLPSPPCDGRVQMEDPYTAALGQTENISRLIEAEKNCILEQLARQED
jgi:hypothetical protein